MEQRYETPLLRMEFEARTPKPKASFPTLTLTLEVHVPMQHTLLALKGSLEML